MKIVFIGAGSIIFVKNLIGDCLLTPCLQDAEYALLDIDKEKLRMSAEMLQQLNRNINGSRATIKAYDSQKDALRNADFVINAILKSGGIPVWAHPLGGEGEQELPREIFDFELKIFLCLTLCFLRLSG